MELWYFCVSEDEEGPPQRRGRQGGCRYLYHNVCGDFAFHRLLHLPPQSHEDRTFKATGRGHVGESGASAVTDIAAGRGFSVLYAW